MLRIRASHGFISERGLLCGCAWPMRGPQLVPFLSDLGPFWMLFLVGIYVKIEGPSGITPRASWPLEFGRLKAR